MTTTHRFPVNKHRTVELKLVAPTCGWPGCGHTVCVEGWTIAPATGERIYGHLTQNFELLDVILPEVRRLASDQLSEDMADEAGVLNQRGEHQPALVMTARSLAISLGDDHPVTRWVTGIAETLNTPLPKEQ